MNDFEIKIFRQEIEDLELINILNSKLKEGAKEILTSVFFKYKGQVCVASVVFGTKYEKTKPEYNLKKKMIDSGVVSSKDFIDAVLNQEVPWPYGSNASVDYMLYRGVEDIMYVLDSIGYIKQEKSYERELEKSIDMMYNIKGIRPSDVYKKILEKYGVIFRDLEAFVISEDNAPGKRNL